MSQRQSTDLSRKQLIKIIAALRGEILTDNPKDRMKVYEQTAFDISDEDYSDDNVSWKLLPNEGKKKYCEGCYNDEYNRGLGGADRCWGLGSATLTRVKFVHINDVPPWNHQRVEETLSCHKRKGFVRAQPNQLH